MTISATSLPPEAALRFWADKVPMTRKEYDALADEARARAFFVSGLGKGDLLNTIKDSLGTALAEGKSFGAWKKELRPELERKGWEGDNPHRLAAIFRNNMQSAYQAGRYGQMQKTKELRPYWQMSGVNDSRTRPSHAALHGVVYPADHEFWDTYYPPNGNLCRCTVISLSARQVEKDGLTVETEVDHLREHPDLGVVNTLPQNGFARNVGKDWWAGVRDLPVRDTHPEAWEEARKHPPQGVRPLAPVKSYEALLPALEGRCGQFMSHGNPVQAKMTNSSYFMATYGDGRIEISKKVHATSRGPFNAARELKDAWNALAAKKPLTWNQEYSLESLWHEIMHNRQVRALGNMRKYSPPQVLMETMTQWTSRRTYQELLAALGGKPLHQADILKNGLGYNHWVRNFDTMLGRLRVNDGEILKAVRHMVETKPKDTYSLHLVDILQKKNPALKAGQVQRLLGNLKHAPSQFDSLLDELVQA